MGPSDAVRPMPASPDRRPRRAAAPSAPLAPEGPSWWDARSSRARHLICLGVLLLAAVVFYAPALFSGKGVVGGDVVKWREMAASMIDHRAATGEEPLWAVNPFGGMPGYLVAYTTKVPGLDTVFQALRAAMWPVSHLMLGLFGVYALVYFLTRRHLPGVVAGLAYGFTTYLPILLVAGHSSKFIALCLAPWVLLAFAFALRRPGLLAGLLFAGAIGLNLRANHPQITYYAVWAIALWWLAEGVAAARAGRLAAFGKATAWLAFGAVVGAAFVADPLLLQMEYKRFTTRQIAGAPGAGHSPDAAFQYAMGWSQGVRELLTLVAADALGGSGQTYWGPKVFTAGPHYVGGVAFLLALVGLALGRRRVALGIGAGVVVMVLFALGEHAGGLNRLMFDAFPFFNAFRAPETWLSMVALLVAILAGLGAAAAARQDEPAEADRRRTRGVYAAAGGTVALALLLVVLKGSQPFEKAGEREQYAAAIAQQAQAQGVAPTDPRVLQAVEGALAEAKAQRVEMYGGATLRFLVFAGLAAALLVLHRRGTLPAWAMQGGLALLVFVDLYGVDRRYFSGDVLAEVPDPEALIERYAYDDFLVERVREAGGPGRFRVLSLEGSLTTTARPAAFYEALGGYHAAPLRLAQDYLENGLADATGGVSANGLGVMGVRYVVAQGVLPGGRPVWPDSTGQPDPTTGMVVTELPNPVPRAHFVGRVEPVADGAPTWARMHDPAFDPRTTALVPAGTSITTTPIDSARAPQATVEQYGPRRIAYRVQTEAPRLLVLSEVFYPAGWKAFVDGRETPIVRTNYLTRGVAVPANAQRVELRFEPARYPLGVGLSALASALVYGGVLVLVALGWRRRRTGVPAPDATVPDPAV